MLVKSLKLRNFRNYEAIDVSFEKGVNAILGINGSGKTNLVEAISVLSLGRSFKTQDDQELIRFGQDFALIEATILKEKEKTLKIVLSKDGKRITYDGIEFKKLSELNGLLQVIIFTPSDVDLFKESPIERRKFLNIHISMINKKYLQELSLYNNLLKERNAALKSEQIDLTLLDVLNKRLVKPQFEILKERFRFLHELEPCLNQVYQYLDSSKNSCQLKYQSTIEWNESYQEFETILLEAYHKNLEVDMKRKATSIGIHRDDLFMFRNQRKIDVYGSQGQNRIGVLSLKLAVYKLFKESKKEEPILILDDVLSELDLEHQNKMMRLIEKTDQVFITCADQELKLNTQNKYIVSQQKITRRN